MGRISSDLNIAASTSLDNALNEVTSTTRTSRHDRHLSAPPQHPQPILLFSENVPDREVERADESPGWGKFRAAADTWIDRIWNNNADPAQSEAIDDSLTGSREDVSVISRIPRPKMKRRATTSTVPDRVPDRGSKLAPSFMRFAGLLTDDHEQSKQSGNNDTIGSGEISQRWKDVKSKLRFIKHISKKKDEEIQRHEQKSTELVTTLISGTPAALILALAFKRDERNQGRLPVLLQLLQVKITDSTRTEDRQHALFRIELEYGSGPVQMKWVVYHDFRDFFNLHSRLKVLDFFQRGSQSGSHVRELPRFPREAIPYLRGVRGLNEADVAGLSLPRQTESRVSLTSAVSNVEPMTPRSHDLVTHQQKYHKFNEKQRIALEQYLKGLIRVMMFQGEANRLCRFLELSAMGLRLSIENSYHGKEGPLTVLSTSSSRGWRSGKLRPKHVKSLFTRYGSKWFLVRHSYILVVDSFLDIAPIDVFMVDPEFKFTHQAWGGWHANQDTDDTYPLTEKPKTLTQSVQDTAKIQFSLKLENSERKMKLLALSEKHLKQWQYSIEYMQKNTLWTKLHRFGSFAPVRQNVSAQWFVDGRDYFWNVSHAISMARDVIYIHDWWLSPEIYLRRPGHGNQQWRLDRLLKRKAEEGVKIFVILYRNVGAAIPIDSLYTKQSLLDLHPNIFVARSPNQFRQNILFWAHHEKLVIIDHLVLFVGGLDLCFGRWDTPQHVLTDDKPTGFDRGVEVDLGEDTQLWVGKDYSNARVQDFYDLNKPYNDMYDRSKVPRMPWHDVHMQIIAQPARDAARHFIQRWNYLNRQKRSTRPAPILIPPPDFTDAELEAFGHLGTCEVQLLRSACGWSLGMRKGRVEHSILNAYLKAIEQSEHFVYIENQFFISSTTVDGEVIENAIGDALVERIMRAHKHKEDWRAVIIIPLVPGFEAEVHQQDGTSVRLIMQCQYRSISRGSNSIFGRLNKAGINPEDYIQFFSLRKWGKIGPYDQLVTEQLYIHAKIMVVDDRAAIIGSANINERSMRGTRDSEVAVFVRDTDQIESTMGGKPFMVGRLPHTLRVRLMREHLGIDVDALEDTERDSNGNSPEGESEHAAFDLSKPDIWRSLEKLRAMENGRPQSLVHDDEEMTNAGMYDSEEDEVAEAEDENEDDSSDDEPSARKIATMNEPPVIDVNNDFQARPSDGVLNNFPANDGVVRSGVEPPEEFQHQIDREKHAADLAGFGPDRMNRNVEAVRAMGEAVKQKIDRRKGKQRDIAAPPADQLPPASPVDKKVTLEDVSDEGVTSSKTVFERIQSLSLEPTTCFLNDDETKAILESPSEKLKPITPFSFEDPLDENFYFDIWLAHATNNTNIFREVFRCQPDNEVQSWKDYQDYKLHAEKFDAMQLAGKPVSKRDGTVVKEQEKHHGSSAGGVGLTTIGGPIHASVAAVASGAKTAASEVEAGPSKLVNALAPNSDGEPDPQEAAEVSGSDTNSQEEAFSTKSGDRRRRLEDEYGQLGVASNYEYHHGTTRRSRRQREYDSTLDRDAAEERLNNVRGNLILFPTDWLLKEDEGGNWFYNIDRIPPLEIYD
ncbi:hypothetical protein V1512DRAFT_212936 [Lipomyces arxii]|uniref:uncharacterized protein n=1 Tax=Lipomyces arxii TaxID=56418 RepID=UPI0034CE27CD